MDMKEICPCPKLNCPNHGYCDKCTSKHLRKGSLNYCSFHTLLPTVKDMIDSDPGSPAARKLDALINAQLQAYEKLMKQHGLSQETQEQLLKKVMDHGDH